VICEDIILSLPQLSKEDRQKIKLVLDSLFQEIPQVRDSSAPLSITFNAFKKSFERVGLPIAMPQSILFKKKKDKESALWVFNWVQEKFQAQTRQEQLAVMTYLLTCLINYLRDIDCPISVGIVMNNLRNLPRAIDAHFPGYVESGLSSVIVQGVLKNGNPD